MIKIDLITGFLGSGKTTFIKYYVQYLIAQGQNVGILENDLGAVNVDMMLLQELRGDSCELEMVSACCGNDPETHRRRLRSKLISMGMSGYDRVVMEPSGIFDMDEFFDILHDEPLDRWYEIGSVLAIVDAKLEEPLSEEADYILATEAADAGCVVLSRTQEASDAEIRRTLAHLNRALEQVGCGRRFFLEAEMSAETVELENEKIFSETVRLEKEKETVGEDTRTGCVFVETGIEDAKGNNESVREVLGKDWAFLTDQDFAFLADCGYRSESYVKQDYEEHGDFESLFFMRGAAGEELRSCGTKSAPTGGADSLQESNPQQTEANGSEASFQPGWNFQPTREGLRKVAGQILADDACGRVFRIKGFARNGDGGWLELNATRQEIRIRPIPVGQEVVIVIGEHLNRQVIEAHLHADDTGVVCHTGSGCCAGK